MMMKIKEIQKYALLTISFLFTSFAYGQIKPPSSIEASQGDFTDKIYFRWEDVNEAIKYKVCVIDTCDVGTRIVSSNQIVFGTFKPQPTTIFVYSCSDESCDSTSEESISATGFSDFSPSKTTQDIVVEYDKDNENRLLISTQSTKSIYAQTCIDISCSFPLSYTFNQWKTGNFFLSLDGSEYAILFRFCEIVTNKYTRGYLCEEKKTIVPITPVSNWEDVKGTSFVIDTTVDIQDTTGDDTNSSNNSEDTENDSDPDDNSSDNNSDDASTNEVSNSGAGDTNNDNESNISDTNSSDNENNNSNNNSAVVGSGLKWSMGNWGESNWYKSTWSITTGSSNSTIPEIPQQSLSGLTRTDRKGTKSTLTIGASSDGGQSTSDIFTIDDTIVITAKVYPEKDDIGQAGEIYLVLREIKNGRKVFSALSNDKNWQSWNLSLRDLPTAEYIDSLQDVEEILIHSGEMTEGERALYVGYSLLTEEGKPLIHVNGRPFIFKVMNE